MLSVSRSAIFEMCVKCLTMNGKTMAVEKKANPLMSFVIVSWWIWSNKRNQ